MSRRKREQDEDVRRGQEQALLDEENGYDADDLRTMIVNAASATPRFGNPKGGFYVYDGKRDPHPAELLLQMASAASRWYECYWKQSRKVDQLTGRVQELEERVVSLQNHLDISTRACDQYQAELDEMNARPVKKANEPWLATLDPTKEPD